MSRKSNRPKVVRTPAELETGAGSYWPEDFASLRKSLLIGGGFIVYALVLYGVVATIDLLWAKRLIAWALGFGNPFDIVASSTDLAGLLLVLGGVVAGAAVHPAVGLVLLFLARPWLDGYTYPTDNLYFLWVLLALCGVWGFRLFQRGGRILHGRALALFAGLLVLGVLTAYGSIQYDNTFRQLLYTVAYGAILLLVTNRVNSPAARGVLLAGLLGSMAIQAVYALLHFEYLLPFMRKMVQDPRLLRHFFGTDTLTPELARRFEINRAFGSLLFPNALAAFLILGIPYAIFGGLAAWTSLRPAWRDRVPVSQDPRNLRNALALGAGAWFLTFLGLLGALTFIAGYQPEESQLGAVGIFLMAAVVASLPAGGVWWCTQRYGVVLCGQAVRAVLLPVLALLLVYTLWITYSRGGLLALFLALLLTAALLSGKPEHWARLRRMVPGRRAVVAGLALGLFLAAVGLVAVAAPAIAQDTPGAANGRIETVTEQGQAVQLGELANPESFMLRLTYWRVGVRMFLDNPLGGVGLGNFKVAYPYYQYLGAGHVKEAHNGYLQMFCETGVLGGLWLLGMCLLFAVWGARKLLHAAPSPARLGFAGLYAGVIALLLHAGIDIDLSHPTLMMFLMAFVGLALGMAPATTLAETEAPAEDAPVAAPKAPFVGLTAMVLCALILGLSTRLYAQDLSLSRVSLINVANRQEMMHRLQLGTLLLQEILGTLWDQNRPLRRIPIAELLKLVPDLGVLRKSGDLYAPDPLKPGDYRLVARNEAAPPDALLVLLRPGILIAGLLDMEKGWLHDVERADARFPYSVEHAIYLARWYGLALNATTLPGFEARKAFYQSGLAHWAVACAERSPMLADAQLASADAWWALAKSQAGEEQRASFEKGLAAYERATACNTVLGDYNVYYGQALNTLADAKAAAGDAAGAAAYRAQAEAQTQLGMSRQKARWELGL